MAVRFAILGTIEVRRDGVAIDVGHAMQRRVLAALLVDADRAVSVDALVDRVWGHAEPVHGRRKLYGYVSRLRHALAADGTAITRERGGGYRLAVEPSVVDAHRFRELSGRARKTGCDGQAEVLWREALALWRGSAFAGVDTPWFNAQRHLLDGERLAAQLELVDVRLRLAQHDGMVSELAARAEAYPLDERVIGQLILALYRCGRQAEALETYERARRRLADELGVDPGAALRRLYEQILAGDPEPAAPRSAAPPATAKPAGKSGTATNPPMARQLVPRLLPADLSLFVGRKDEVDEARRLLGEERPGPVTLLVTGAAGVGKTAFAVRTGHLLASRFPDGQLHADLRGFGDEPAEPFTVLGTFLRALGIPGGTVPAELTDRVHLYRTLLAGRQMLVVLDNAASAQQVSDLLPSGVGCAAVVTSRTTMAELSGRRLPLGVLDTATGLDLLREMLGRDRTDAEPDPARSIVETCGGLPLAVWVAGARLAARPHWPLAKVARALADEQRKLDELAVGHIAVRASLELTYQQMTPATQRALRMIALLPGPNFAAWALAALLDADLPKAEAVLDDLVEVHLVQISSANATGIRYQLHDLVRLFARERAEQDVQEQDRTAALTRLLGASLHLADLAADALSVDFQGISQLDLASWRLAAAEADQLLADPLTWFNDERQFLIDVAEQALDATDGVAPAAGLATALTTLFQVGSHFDDWERLQNRALKAALSSGDRHSAAKVHRCLGELTTILDRYTEALDHFEQALQLAEGQGPTYRASATAGLAYVHRLLGQYTSAAFHFEEAAELAESAGNVNCLVYATNGLGVIDLEQGRVEAAAARFTKCLRVSRVAGYRPGEAQALRCLGQSHRALGAYPAAADAYRLAVAISEDLGDRLSATHATCWLGDVLVRQGEHREGRRLLARSLWSYREFGNLWGEAATLYALAEAHLAVGRSAPARRRAEAAVSLWRQIGSSRWLAVGLDTLAKAHALAGDHEAADRARAEAEEVRTA
ncbi:response regulator [Streptomyces viridochromogenes DSM 40736]|uniref:Response regulator n=1 Tax=Streptomyces viridochromogenes (strain DSM 40736 / JCM 4977 / BCRC 1201 / Tue 494) TaxID=591159 RepID=D9X396_STRVT|nr:BTAD domain-containing putative transcriptional regulator [Streptomyces viridochromogenes]EFL29612.1 response regulator [Streptomyces viridochromogenes DSM 40736]